MKRQLCTIAMALLCLAGPATATTPTDSSVKGWVASSLPANVTIQTSTPAQLAAAVKAAILKHRKEAKAIVAYVFSQLKVTDRAKAIALIDVIVKISSEREEVDLINLAIESLSGEVDPLTGNSPRVALGSVITQAALAADSRLSAGVVALNGEGVSGPSSWNSGLSTQLLGPGNVTNPANISNTNGQVNSAQ